MPLDLRRHVFFGRVIAGRGAAGPERHSRDIVAVVQSLANIGLVFLGGGVGSALRYGVGRAALTVVGPGFPAGTFAVNIVGCVLMGALVEWLAFRDTGIHVSTKLFLTTGVLGGFTTFSAFALDAAALWGRGTTGLAALYVFASVALSIAGLFGGMALVRAALAS